MSIPTLHAATLAIFCKVVDNYGDIGICWRLARQLAHAHGLTVTLWVDDLHSFQRICPQVDPEPERQSVAGIEVRHWRDQDGTYTPADIAGTVIEFFGCELPPGYIAAMAACTPRPVWLNLEGLSAEEWVEGCHTLPSPHPRLPLTKHFFFPGFTGKTGGLLIEPGLIQQRRRFQADPAAPAAFLAQLGLTADELAGLKVSMFCYPHAPLAELFEAWQGAAAPITCLVPEGVASAAVAAFLGAPAHAGAHARRGALSVRVLPFLPQQDYDELLWSCDLNFVRGEDSFVRAQCAARPFVWHIYPQDENLHHKKLNAFLQRYGAAAASLRALTHAWNRVGTAPQDWAALWQQLRADLPAIALHAEAWLAATAANGDLATNLLAFADTIRRKNKESALQ